MATGSGDKDAKSNESSSPWDDNTRRRFESKSKSEFYDPCQEAAQRSYRCLFRNNGDKAMCGEYFQAYRDCKQHWVRIAPRSTLGFD
ncbi:uncharacterized protein F5Z01DRAFT_631467 [Emericellopsis atlantica]|uniref:Cytochrome c oxidase-assembly factor COX23, mitochondrial n=1 Tax=Emericellopsis atlantica TaxID=2614577 RepID=A0A9P8CK43_9HYPO|nr:uncharacterized protein F5Z01DRAFT_631467 [Emericellopsis atlantica]KAG9249555.1 hypothetical protein F5Z01DRAFT_631467 [Emericellopsis atlantica]